MEAVISKYESRLTIDTETRVEDEFNFELTGSHFQDSLRRIPKEMPTKISNDENKDVYFDKSTGKLIVTLKKMDRNTGVKRPIERTDREEELNSEANVG